MMLQISSTLAALCGQLLSSHEHEAYPVYSDLGFCLFRSPFGPSGAPAQ